MNWKFKLKENMTLVWRRWKEKCIEEANTTRRYLYYFKNLSSSFNFWIGSLLRPALFSIDLDFALLCFAIE